MSQHITTFQVFMWLRFTLPHCWDAKKVVTWRKSLKFHIFTGFQLVKRIGIELGILGLMLVSQDSHRNIFPCCNMLRRRRDPRLGELRLRSSGGWIWRVNQQSQPYPIRKIQYGTVNISKPSDFTCVYYIIIRI